MNILLRPGQNSNYPLLSILVFNSFCIKKNYNLIKITIKTAQKKTKCPTPLCCQCYFRAPVTDLCRHCIFGFHLRLIHTRRIKMEEIQKIMLVSELYYYQISHLTGT